MAVGRDGAVRAFPDAVVVGGRVHRQVRLPSAGSYFGFGRGYDSPGCGRAAGDFGHAAQLWKPHTVSAVPIQHCVVEPAFFRDFLMVAGHAAAPMPQLSAWFGAFARNRGQRIVYSPFLTARSVEDVEGYADAAERPRSARRTRRLDEISLAPSGPGSFNGLSSRDRKGATRACAGLEDEARRVAAQARAHPEVGSST
jgi:hypothetical protein